MCLSLVIYDFFKGRWKADKSPASQIFALIVSLHVNGFVLACGVKSFK